MNKFYSIALLIRLYACSTTLTRNDAAFPGVFHKTVSVIYNGPGSSVSLEINGEVEYPENSKL